jgi:hypothetical protein
MVGVGLVLGFYTLSLLIVMGKNVCTWICCHSYCHFVRLARKNARSTGGLQTGRPSDLRSPELEYLAIFSAEGQSIVK